MTYASKVMNIKMKEPTTLEYRIGHRDARHSAVELVQELESKYISLLTKQQKWRPVDPKYPPRGILLGSFINVLGKRRTVKCAYYGQFELEYHGDYYNDDAFPVEYDEDSGEYFCPSGWYEEIYTDVFDYSCVYIGEAPTHWMPLPIFKENDSEVN